MECDRFKQRFLELFLGTDMFIPEGTHKTLNPLFEGNAHAVQLAAQACRAAMNNPTNGLYEAQVLFAFEPGDYPLLSVAALPFLGGDAKQFIYYTHHHKFPQDFLRGKKVVILATRENEVQLHGAGQYLEKYGAIALGVVVFFSPAFMQQQNEELPLPVVRIICEHELLQSTTIGRPETIFTESNAIDQGRDRYLLPG